MSAQNDGPAVTVTLDYVEAMGTIAALRAVIDSTPGTVVPTKLVDAERKIVDAARTARGAADGHGSR